jgi:diadenosine tetraphosphate (Ap4A) HIT family hydrolase
MDCLFCNLDREIIAENKAAYATFDDYAVSLGHSLIIPKRHVETVFELEKNEYAQCFELVRDVKSILESRYATADFNVGINSGAAAGQTISHV